MFWLLTAVGKALHSKNNAVNCFQTAWKRVPCPWPKRWRTFLWPTCTSSVFVFVFRGQTLVQVSGRWVWFWSVGLSVRTYSFSFPLLRLLPTSGFWLLLRWNYFSIKNFGPAVTEHLLSMHGAVGSISSAGEKKEEKRHTKKEFLVILLQFYVPSSSQQIELTKVGIFSLCRSCLHFSRTDNPVC